MRARIVLALLLFCPAVAPLHAQAAAPPQAQPAAAEPVAARINLGRSIIALYGPWKFHTGDDMAWANPNFDDSRWETVDLTPRTGAVDPVVGISGYVPGWTAKGHPGYWGYAWYRIRVQVSAPPGEKLALAGPADVDDAYQVFVNGVLRGSFGQFRGPGTRPVIDNTQPEMFSLPPAIGPATQVVAFRVWMDAGTLMLDPDAGGLHIAPLLGQAGVIAAQNQLGWQELVRSYESEALESLLFLLLAILACSLVLFDRSDPVYVWLAAVFLLTAIDGAMICVAAWTQVIGGVALDVLVDAFLGPLILGGWMMVWWIWFRLRRPAWVPRAIVALTVLYGACDLMGVDTPFTLVSHPVSAGFQLASVGIRLLFLLLLVIIAVWGIRQRGREGWLALPAMVLMGVAQFENELRVLHVPTVWFLLGIQARLGQIASVAMLAVIFALLLRRLRISIRHQRELALDVKQAREVQQVLIPEQLPKIPGLAIESEYRPAREVGGDFFQIVRQPTDGSVLIVVGDVTGKGLQAGMLVALIVGAIRSTAEIDADPLFLLNALNRRLLGRGQAHATCLALRIEADGSVTLANAGHLPPYLNGKELRMAGALPLGMIEHAEFSLTHFQLDPGDTLMLLSDGVVEAQDEQGRLFGFERVDEMLRNSTTAADIASAAQAFGQQDDISVLKVARTAEAVYAA